MCYYSTPMWYAVLVVNGPYEGDHDIMSNTAEVTAPLATKRQVDLTNQLVELERQAEEIEASITVVREKLITSIGLGNAIEVPGVVRFAVTQSTTYDCDLDALVALRRHAFTKRVTKTVLDVAKFGRLVRDGEIPAEVAALVRAKTSKMTLRPTWRS